jgi:DNA-directed RNA polymerase specialized sigma24 family protein
VEFDLLEDDDAEVVAEHVAGCPDCRLFTEQVDRTREIVRHVAANHADPEAERSLAQLYRAAGELDLRDVDDVVQQAAVDALGVGSLARADEFVRAATQTGRDVDSLDAGGDDDVESLDADSESSELFYPDFYASGPDAGRFVDAVDAWGETAHASPEDETTAVELIEVAAAALDRLPGLERQLMTLVDIEGWPLRRAADELHVGTQRAVTALNRARVHVRGSVDAYLASG